jgi:hypothetical protein
MVIPNHRETQAKARMRSSSQTYQYSTLKTQRIARIDKDAEKLEPCILLVRMENVAATMENGVEWPQKQNYD